MTDKERENRERAREKGGERERRYNSVILKLYRK